MIRVQSKDNVAESLITFLRNHFKVTVTNNGEDIDTLTYIYIYHGVNYPVFPKRDGKRTILLLRPGSKIATQKLGNVDKVFLHYKDYTPTGIDDKILLYRE